MAIGHQVAEIRTTLRAAGLVRTGLLHLCLLPLHEAVECRHVVIRGFSIGQPFLELPFEPRHIEASKIAPKSGALFLG